MKKTVTIMLFLAALTTVRAGIVWKTKEVSIEVKAGQGPVEVQFPFVITGSEAVGVVSTKASSDCIAVDPIADELKPGTQGVLKARYTPGNGAGTTVEKITVNTTDAKASSVELRLLVYTLLTYRIDPNYAIWKVNDTPDAKNVYFINVAGKGYKPVAVYSTSPNFTATLIPPEGRATRYVIKIKPVSTKEAHGAFVYVDVDMGDGTIEKRKIIAAIHDSKDAKIQIDAQ